MFVVEKPPFAGHDFAFDRPGREDGGARHRHARLPRHALLRGRFDNWFVPAENLIGLDSGLGKGFYLQMEGFENGRLQTRRVPSA